VSYCKQRKRHSRKKHWEWNWTWRSLLYWWGCSQGTCHACSWNSCKTTLVMT